MKKKNIPVTENSLYSLLVSFSVWSVLLPWQLLSLITGKSSWDEISQRLARIGTSPSSQSETVVIHAVSYGEMLAASPIISKLVAENVNIEIILTTGNQDGMKAARSLQSSHLNIVRVLFLPWDRAHAIKHWLTTLAPDLFVIVETEIWPNLIATCRDQDIPVCIVNGRIYPKDVARYGLISKFMRNVFSNIDWIGVQDKFEYERFLAIGAPAEILQIVGNLKYDQIVRGDVDSKPIPVKNIVDGRVLLAGSTHAPEEEIIFEAYKTLKLEFPDLQLVLAPRKVSRVDKIEKWLKRHKFRVERSSTLQSSNSSWDVLIVDELGQLTRLYELADIVFVGGSLVNHGGHNLLEAAVKGKAIVVGPYMQHFQGIVDEFHRKDALVQLHEKSDLENTLRRLLMVPEERLNLGKEARSIVQDNKGCSQGYTQMLRQLITRYK